MLFSFTVRSLDPQLGATSNRAEDDLVSQRGEQPNHARSLRSTRTEATTHVDRIRESNAGLEKKHPLSGGGLAWPLTAHAATPMPGSEMF
jgi:hypothetical protein